MKCYPDDGHTHDFQSGACLPDGRKDTPESLRQQHNKPPDKKPRHRHPRPWAEEVTEKLRKLEAELRDCKHDLARCWPEWETAHQANDDLVARHLAAQAQVQRLREALAGFTDVSEASGCDECRICKACRKAARAALAEWEAQRG